MRIDAHQHFWRVERGDYYWLTPEKAPIYRDFLPDDLAPLLSAAGIDGTILVQAAPTVAETEFMLSVAAKADFVKGVVGWVDFEGADVADQIARLNQDALLVGLRPMIQDIEPEDWMLQPRLGPAFEALTAHDLTFDALTLPKHLPHLRELLARNPSMRVIIDHASKPLIRRRVIDPWANHMAALARDTTAFCKLSGLVTEAAEEWSVEDLRPYVDHILDTFGPERLIWGSDWPVCTLAASYREWIDASERLLQDLSPSQKAAVWGGNAVRAYQLEARAADPS